MNVRSTCMSLVVVTSVLCGASGLSAPVVMAEEGQPNMLEIVGGAINGGVQANIAQPQLVRSIYHAILSLPEQAADKVCAFYVTAQYHLTFLHGASSLLSANVQQGGCLTVALGQDDLRAADPAFWTLLEQTHVVKNVHQAENAPDGLRPDDLQSAYALPGATAGKGQTVAIVDANDDPLAEADLAVYRATFGLPVCSRANGCFRKVDQLGGTNYPAVDIGWAAEVALDVDMVSAICPLCHILLVEANSATFGDLGSAVDTAVRLGASVVSNSYGSREKLPDATTMAHYYDHPGVVITASSGDNGYGTQLPAAFKGVIAVGGTTLSRASNARGWAESAWGGTGSGCSKYISKPVWQSDHGCSYRTLTDVAAVADPDTGVAVYNTYESYEDGWSVNGGTSASSPIIASIYALAGNAATVGGAYLYSHSADLNDITEGVNGTCKVAYLCAAGSAYDGPTGLGTPKGIAAF
jgi:subtilase family serine protease